ncbi:ribose transport system ATP-binding protein/rhamnose transport system ATP-binding protein [Rhodoplanes tepidamans]|nr:ribose transport system ATP-binding protein/rhamnose transport system ATP-binding protein [Rhodoplanes tepidamans]
MIDRRPEVSRTSPPPRLTATGISKRFGAVRALYEVGLTVQPGEIHALCGENGSGKSTLVKILTGTHQPDTGTVAIDGRPVQISSPQSAEANGIAIVSQELSLCPDLTVLDNIWLGSARAPLFPRKALLARDAQRALDMLGASHIGLDQRVSGLEMGQKQLVEIARMLVRDARLLILDEPTATLSDRDIHRLFAALAALRREGRSVIYITHRLAEVFELCDSVTVLRNGRLVAARPAREFDRESLVESMLGRPLADLYPSHASSHDAPALVIENLRVPGIVKAFDLEVPRRAITCIVGQIGSGAPEVVQALAGLIYNATGSVRVDGRRLSLGSPQRAAEAGIMYVSGDRAQEGVFLELPVRDNLTATRLGALSTAGLLSPFRLRRVARALAAHVGLHSSRLPSAVAQLSGGNQQKVAFGRCVDNRPNGILAMIEPTRGVDVGARADLYRMMREFCESGYAIVMTCTDLEEVLGLADYAVTMFRGAQIRRIDRAHLSIEHLLLDITHPEELPTDDVRAAHARH